MMIFCEWLVEGVKFYHSNDIGGEFIIHSAGFRLHAQWYRNRFLLHLFRLLLLLQDNILGEAGQDRPNTALCHWIHILDGFHRRDTLHDFQEAIRCGGGLQRGEQGDETSGTRF